MNKAEFMKEIARIIAGIDLEGAPVDIKAQQQALKLIEVNLPRVQAANMWGVAYEVLKDANNRIETLLNEDEDAPIKMTLFKQEEE